jgi:glycosyltransferase involved in cell wall biosynthesis
LSKRIAFVTYNYWPPQFGGELIISVERFQGLVERGFEVLAFVSGAKGFSRHQVDNGVTVFRSPLVGSSRLARLLRRVVYLFWVAWQLIRTDFEIYYQGDTAGIDRMTSALSVRILTSIAHWKKARTVIVHSLADTEHKAFDSHGWAGFWRRFMFAGFDYIVTVSPGLYEGLKPVFPERARLIVNGVRDDLFTPLLDHIRREFRQRHGVSDDDVVFAFLGTVGYRKGFDLLAQAFLNLVGSHPNWYLWVIGPYLPEHSQNIDKSKAQTLRRLLEPVASQVKYWGRVDEREQLNRIISACDVFVFPSRREGMGLAPVEAMAAGLPVVISRIPNITDLASVEAETGYYVPVGDVSALQGAMERLANDADLRQVMGRKAVERVRAHFGWQAHLDQWQELYFGAFVRLEDE